MAYGDWTDRLLTILTSWLFWAALLIFALALFAASDIAAQTQLPNFMRDSGTQSFVFFIQNLETGPQLALGTQVSQGVAWLALPFLLAFILIYFGLQRVFKKGVAAGIALLIALLVYTSPQYLLLARAVNAFGPVSVGLVFIALLLVIAAGMRRKLR